MVDIENNLLTFSNLLELGVVLEGHVGVGWPELGPGLRVVRECGGADAVLHKKGATGRGKGGGVGALA